MIKHKIRLIILLLTVLLTTISYKYMAAQNCLPKIAHDSLQLVTDGVVFCSESKGDTMYIGGVFKYIGKYTGGIGRINDSGSLNIGSNWPRVHGRVYTVVADGNGGYYIGGRFSKIGDSARSNFAHVDSQWRVTAFRIEAGTGNSTYITSIVPHNNKLYIAGSFWRVNGLERSHAACVEIPSLRVLKWNPGVQGRNINAMVLYKDKIYLGGDFSGFNHAPGPVDSNLAVVDTLLGDVIKTGYNANGTVRDMFLDGDTLYVAGLFQKIAGKQRTRVASIHLPGDSLTSWNPIVNSSYDFCVNSIAVSGQNIYLGGRFDSVNSVKRESIALVNKNSGSLLPWAPGFKGGVTTISIYGDKVYIGGKFDSVGGKRRINIAMVDTAGNVSDWNPGVNLVEGNSLLWESVEEIIRRDNNIYIAGAINSCGGKAVKRLASFNAKTSEIFHMPSVSFSGQSSTTGYTESVRVLKRIGNMLYIGGIFDKIDTNKRRTLAAFDLNTYKVTAWQTDSLAGYPMAIELSDSLLYVGGDFSAVGTTSRKNICAFDTATGALLSFNQSNDGSAIRTIKTLGSNLFIGGDFTTFAGQSRNSVAVINKSTSALQPWKIQGSSVHPVDKIQFYNNRVYVCGQALRKMDTTTSNPAPQTYGLWGGGLRSVVLYNGKAYAGGFQTMAALDTVNNSTNKLKLGMNWEIYDVNNVDSSLFAFGDIRYIYKGEKLLTHMVRFHISTVYDTPYVTITPPSQKCPYWNYSSDVWYAHTNVDAPLFYWTRNGLPANTTESPVAGVGPYNGDKVVCTVEPRAGCYATPTISSDTVIATLLTPTVTSASLLGDSVFCANNLYTETYFAQTSFTPDVYRWKVGGQNIANTSDSLNHYPTLPAKIITYYAYVPDTGCYDVQYVVVKDTPLIYRVDTPIIFVSGPPYPMPEYSRVVMTANLQKVPMHYNIKWRNNGILFCDTNHVNTVAYTKPKGTDRITATIKPAGCYEEVTSNVFEIQGGVGINDVSETTEIKVSPNPFYKTALVTGLNSGDKIQLYDMLQRKLLEKQADKNNGIVYIEGNELPPGSYILEVTGEGGVIKSITKLQKL